jgi:hypothetical protein
VSYAEGTRVPWAQSRNEIEAQLAKAGAEGFAFASSNCRAIIGFSIAGRAVKIELPLPTPGEVAKTPTGKTRSLGSIEEAHAAEVRRRWRSLGLVIKAKLTAVSDGISTVEREFLADMVMKDGRTVHSAMIPKLAAAKNGAPLLMLEDGS